jgi:molybdate transport system regulatory protein
MKSSACNQYYGTFLSVKNGAINDEVEVMLDSSSTRITAVITGASCKAMALETGKKVVTIIKEEWITLIKDTEGYRFSTRNLFHGTVVSVKESSAAAEVHMRLVGGESLTAIVTSDAAKSLDIKTGDKLSALFKAPMVLIGVKE